jgi:Holliday junction DNA helicase RuvA
MIGSLRGVVLDRQARPGQATEVLLEVGGVGYRVQVPSGSLGRIGRPGSPAFLHVHTHVREDALVLYGFPTREERVCFEALIGAHGVGPAVALALLSVHSPIALQRAVVGEDAEALMLVPGIGKKTAARLIVELKARLDVDLDTADLQLVGVAASGPDGDGNGSDPAASAVTRSEVRAALSGLGYAADEIRHALSRLPAHGTVEDQIRLALRELAGAR